MRPQYPTATTSTVMPATAALIAVPPTTIALGIVTTPDAPVLLCAVRLACAEFARVASADTA